MIQRKRFLGRGLALTDALVMVAVIALLFSVLLPALAKTREAARRSMCAENMHHLMVGVLSYANDHANKGPMRGWFTYTVAETPHEAFGWGGNSSKVLINLAQLYPTWIGGQYDRLYCPSRYMYRDGPTGWKSAFNPMHTFSHGGYDYSILLAPRSGSRQSPDFSGPNPFPPEIWSRSFADWVHNWEIQHPGVQFRVPDHPALVTDWFIPPQIDAAHSDGINVLYTDGHVRFHNVIGDRKNMYDVWYKVSLKQ